MKKLTLLAFVCLLSFTVMAQKPLNIGVHGGFSNTRINAKELTDGLKSKSHNGYLVGVFGRINLGGLYIEPSLNFAHKESEVELGTEKGYLKYNSFDIPVMIGFRLINFGIANIRAFAGPVASFTGKVKNTSSFMPEVDNDKTMWNGKVGVGVDVWKFTLDVDYEKGFKKFEKDVKSPRSFNFTLGFKII